MIKTLIERPEIRIDPHAPGVREMAVLFNNADVWHYKAEGATGHTSDAAAMFIQSLLDKRNDLLKSDLPIIHSKQHNKTIYAHKADA